MTTRNVVVFDIDGTLADCGIRLPYILENKPPDWDTFDSLTPNDLPIPGMIRMLQTIAINPMIDIILLTGRANRGNVREMTIAWLEKHGMTTAVEFDYLVMRNDGDHRPAAIMKEDKLAALGYTPDRVITIFEDDPKTINHLRFLGYHVCDVGGWKDEYHEVLSEGGPE